MLMSRKELSQICVHQLTSFIKNLLVLCGGESLKFLIVYMRISKQPLFVIYMDELLNESFAPCSCGIKGSTLRHILAVRFQENSSYAALQKVILANDIVYDGQVSVVLLLAAV